MQADMVQHGLSQRWHQFRAGEPSAEGGSHFDQVQDQKAIEKQLMAPQKQREHRTAVGTASGGGGEGEIPVSGGGSGHVLFESDSSSGGDSVGSEEDDNLNAKAAAVRRTQRRAKREWCAIMRAASAIQGEFWSQSSMSTVQTQEMRRNLVDDDSSTSCSDDSSTSSSDDSENHVEEGQYEDDKTMGLELDGSAAMGGNEDGAHAVVDDVCGSLSNKDHEEHEGPLSQPQNMPKKQEVSNSAGIARLEEVRASNDEDQSDHGSYDEADYGSDDSTNSQSHCSSDRGSVDRDHSEHGGDLERRSECAGDDGENIESQGASDFNESIEGGHSVDGFVNDEHPDDESDDEEHSDYGCDHDEHSDYGSEDGVSIDKRHAVDGCVNEVHTGHGSHDEEHSQYESDDGVNSQNDDGMVDEDHSYHEHSARGSVDEGHSDYDSDDGANSQSHGASAVESAAVLDEGEMSTHCSSDDSSDDSSRSTLSGGSSGNVDVVKTSCQDAAEKGMVREQQHSTWSVMHGIDEDGREQEHLVSARFSEGEESMYSGDEESAIMSKQKSHRQFFEDYDYDDEGCKSWKNGTREVPSGGECDGSFLASGDAEGKDAGKAAHSSPFPTNWIKTKKWYILSYILVIAGIVAMVALAVPMSKKDGVESSQNDEQSAPSPPSTTVGGGSGSPHTGGEYTSFGPAEEEFVRFTEKPTPEETFTSSAAFRTKTWHEVGAKIFAASDSSRNRNDGVHVPSQSGFSVSLSQTGYRVAVGSRYDSSRGMDRAGSVSVYEFTRMLNGGFWRSLGIIHGHFPGDQLGFSVSLSDQGDILAVGAIGSDGNGDRSGQVRVFRYDSLRMQWVPYGQPLYGANPLDLFGMSVSLSGSGRRLAVGSPYHDDDGAQNSGCAAVFEYDALADQWDEMLGSRQKGNGGENYFGWSVSLSSDGNHLAVGAPNRSGLGYVRLYHAPTSESSRWESSHTIESEDVGDYFGYSISLAVNGEVLAIGAPNGSKNGAASGYVGVYSNPVSSSSLRGDYLVGGNAGDGKGYSVDLSSNGLRLIVGSPSHDSGNGAKSGRCSIHQFNGRTWDSGIPVYGTEAQGEAGFDVSISATGTRFAMGVPRKNCTEKCGNGYVLVYE